MADTHWFPTQPRIRYVVATITYSNFAGSWYRYARNTAGKVVRFWTHKAAQAYADKLNETQGPTNEHSQDHE